MKTEFTRRSVLRAAGGIGAAAAAGACSRSAETATVRNRKVTLPAHIAFHGVEPDLPGTAAGVQPGFLRYPADPKPCTDGKPGSGGQISMIGATYGVVAPKPPGNKYWAALNDALGVQLQIQSVESSDMATKLATVFAGGDIPDVVQLTGAIPDLPLLLEKKFQDLTEFLSGDGVQKYPLLAAFRPEQWKTSIYNGSIYGLPIPRDPVGNIMYRRDDIIEAKELDPEPKSFAEFAELCKELTDSAHNRYAVAGWAALINFVQETLGAPNGWREKGGKFTSEYEDESYKQALSAVRDLVAAEYLHPDSFADSAQVKLWLDGGQIALLMDNYTAWWPYVFANQSSNRQMKLGAMLPPPFDSGSKPAIRRGSPNLSTAIFKKADKARIEELLRVANYLAAPFGTREFLIKKYGVPGVDYTLKNGKLSYTAEGVREASETALPIRYYAAEEQVIYMPGFPDDTRRLHSYERAAVPMTVANPTIGLYSNTNSTKGATLSDLITGAQTDILQGRKPVSDWDQVIRTWRDQGGDQIRKEYEEAFARAH